MNYIQLNNNSNEEKMPSWKNINKNPTKSYQFKLPHDERLNWFQTLTTKAAQKLLQELWSEDWIEKLGESGLKAYKIINEEQVKREGSYLPSRIRRGIAEWVGRIIRGQDKRYQCFLDCLEIISWLGPETNENKLIAVVMQHCRTISKNEKTYSKYKKVMVKQTIAMIEHWQKRMTNIFELFNYSDIVKPEINKYAFPFGPDDEQAIQYYSDGKNIHLRIKQSTCPEPKNRSDWEWVEKELVIPDKIKEKITEAVSRQPQKPTLRTQKLKGGLDYFFLQFPWEYPKTRMEENGRVLAMDQGLKKVATIVIFEDGKQISKPMFVKLKGSQHRHIERIYSHIGNNQKQLAKLMKRKLNKQIGLTTYEEERRRLYEKRNRLGEELAHTSTNILIQIAQKWQCMKIVIEDLRNYKPPRGRRSWSRRLSQWLRGRITHLLEYKCQEKGIKLQKVCPWNTSSHCPRCAAKGLKVLGPNNLIENKCGRFFHCPECSFTADRDYIAAVNIYRASFINYRTIKSLKDTSPIPYTDIGIPHSTVLSGGSEMNCSNLLVAVTGND